ncbi:hypothetical protein BaRGS_00005163, partial [Batillaria attramentaria]
MEKEVWFAGNNSAQNYSRSPPCKGCPSHNELQQSQETQPLRRSRIACRWDVDIARGVQRVPQVRIRLRNLGNQQKETVFFSKLLKLVLFLCEGAVGCADKNLERSGERSKMGDDHELRGQTGSGPSPCPL